MTRPRQLLTLGLIVAAAILIPVQLAYAWHLDSQCFNNVWVVSNPESEVASTNVGPIPAHGTINVPDNVDQVTASWPSDQAPHSYTRPAGCHTATPTTKKETPPSPSTSTSPSTTASVTASTSTTSAPPAMTTPSSTSTTPPTKPSSPTSFAPSTTAGPTSTTGSPGTARPATRPSATAAAAPRTNQTPLPETGTRHSGQVAVWAAITVTAGALLLTLRRRAT